MATGQCPVYLDGKLSEGDLCILREALHCIRHKYEDFGMHIGVDSRDIDAIKHDTDRDSGIRLQEVLKFRLRQSPALTWGDIDKALRSNTINEPRLADSILEQCRVRSEEKSSLQQEDDSSSSSSSSSDESSSDCDDILKDLSATENKQLGKIFKRFFGRLCRDISNPADIAVELQAKGLIKRSVMKDLLLSPESNQAKTIKLVENIQKQIKHHPRHVFKIIKLLLQTEALRDLGTEMKIATGKVCPEKSAIYFNEGSIISPPSEQRDTIGVEKMAEVPSSEEGSYSLTTSVSQLEMTPALAIFKKYLQSVYQARELAPADKYLPTLESPYIKLAMISKDTRDQGDVRDEFTKQTLHGGVDQIFKHKIPINIEHLIAETDSESQVSSEGPMYDEHGKYSQAMIIRDTNYQEEERDALLTQSLQERVDHIRKRKAPFDAKGLLVKKRYKIKFIGVDSEGPEQESYAIEGMEIGEDSKGPEHDSETMHAGNIGKGKAKEKNPIKFVLVEGPPGIGKSTLAWEICRKWEEIECLKQFLIVLLIKLREKWVLNATSLADLFRYEHDPELSKVIAGEISDPKIQRRILLVLDGFDEVSHSFHEDSVAKRILRRELLPECTIILTTRPSARATLQSMCQPRIDKHVEIIGFTEEERVRFIVEIFSKDPELQANFLNYMFHIPHIKSMMYIPLNCAIIAQVYYESQSSRVLAIPKTRTQLYRALIHSLLVRHMKTKESSREYACMLPEGLDKKDMEKFKALAQFAFDSYHKKSRKVTFFKEDIPEGLVHFGFMNESCEIYACKGVEKFLSFLHLSIQEYLAAWHMKHCCSIENHVIYHQMALAATQNGQQQKIKFHELIQSKLRELETKDPLTIIFLDLMESLVEPAVFLAGISGWQDHPEHDKNHWKTYLTDDTVDINNPNLLLRSLYEAQNPIHVSHYFIHENRRNITIGSDGFNYSDQTPYDCYALSYCIAHSSHEFSLDVGIGDENNLEAFVMGINDHCKCMPAITSLKVNFSRSLVELYNRCFFWLSKMDLSNTLDTLELRYCGTKIPSAQDFIRSLTNLKSLFVRESILHRADLSTVSLDWLPVLPYLTKLENLYLYFPRKEGILPSNGFDCLPKEYNLKEVLLRVYLPSYPKPELSSLVDAAIGSLLKLSARSNQISTMRLPCVSRETMSCVRSILLQCPSLVKLVLDNSRLGYDGILFICSGLRNNTTLKHLEIDDDPQTPPFELWSYSLKFHNLSDKCTTCTDFLLELNNILKNNTTLQDISIQCRLFRPLSVNRMLSHDITLGACSNEVCYNNIISSQLKGIGPLQQFNIGSITSGRSPNLRRSFSSSDLTHPQTNIKEYDFETNCDEVQQAIEFEEQREGLSSHPSFIAPDTPILQSFASLDFRLRECLKIFKIDEYTETLTKVTKN